MTVIPLSVFEAEKAIARRTGQCMACDRPTRRLRRGEHVLVCGHPDCDRYYQSLYYNAVRRKRRAERRATRRAVAP